ncbi:hypothetical protein ACFQPA_01945 [Halomarina halobia]|uniref:Uncharacterized protein n=1 Tax=Halomarina halobia TaxID=3033386 RepID=A0ABD6A4U7_9EURY|nr:hypothetical protein [Halomarina sp. PSR21]
MPRNAYMIGLCLVALGLLGTAVIGEYRLFSYLAALLIVGVVGASSIERAGREFDLGPYTLLLGWVLGTFVVGLSAIWLLWTPGQTEYAYALGLPQSTLAYVVFIWLLPLVGAVYYSVLFPRIGGDDVVDEIMAEARTAQSREAFPLSPEQPAVGSGARHTDGGESGGEEE